MNDEFAFLDDIAARLMREHLVPNGWHRAEDRPLHTDLLLIISELIEAFEDERRGKTESDKLPGFTTLEEEAADVILRVLSTAAVRGWRIGAAVRAKHAYNVGRPYRHGKRF